MKFVAACLAFSLTLCTIIWLMMKMAGTDMPAHPLDLEKERIEYVMQMEDQAELSDERIDLVDYEEYFERNRILSKED